MSTHSQPVHHPSEALLLGYAGGSLVEAETLAIGAHLALCPHCRKAVAAAEAIGGALLERVAATPVAAGSLQAVLAQLDEAPREATPALEARASLQGLPSALARYVGAAEAESGWRSAGPGVQQLRLKTEGAAQARLLRLKPGTPLPEHSHRGSELTLLLAGSYTDELGHFARGDLAELDESVTHRPVVDPGAECLALIVTEAPLKFRGLLARLAQPFIGI